jgi:hypothetical protein
MSVVFTGYSGFPHKKTDRHNITEILLKIADINLNLMQILASDKIQEYVLKQMLIRTVKANNLMDITVYIPLYNSYIFLLE